MPTLLWYICFTATLVSLLVVIAPTSFLGRDGSRATAIALVMICTTASLMVSFTTQLATTGDVPRILTLSTADLIARRGASIEVRDAARWHPYPHLLGTHLRTASIER